MLGATITGESRTKHYNISSVRFRQNLYDKRDFLYLDEGQQNIEKTILPTVCINYYCLGPTLLSETHQYNNICEFPFKRLTSLLNLCMKCWARGADKLLCQMFHRKYLVTESWIILNICLRPWLLAAAGTPSQLFFYARKTVCRR